MGCAFECSLSNKRLNKEMRLGFKRCSGVCLTNDDIRTRTSLPFNFRVSKIKIEGTFIKLFEP